LFIGTNFNFRFSDEARALGFTVLVDMRGATWSTVKPILKALHEHFPPGAVHQALIVKPDNFWQKQRTSLGSHKYKFEVKIRMYILYDWTNN
jgi:kalirin